MFGILKVCCELSLVYMPVLFWMTFVICGVYVWVILRKYYCSLYFCNMFKYLINITYFVYLLDLVWILLFTAKPRWSLKNIIKNYFTVQLVSIIFDDHSSLITLDATFLGESQLQSGFTIMKCHESDKRIPGQMSKYCKSRSE